MAKDIKDLVSDIYRVLDEGADITESEAEQLGSSFAKMLRERLSKEERQQKRHLRMSSLGQKCNRKLWLEINRPETVEKLPPNVRMKFLFGDVIEALVLFLAKLAGHSVEGEQDELVIDDIKGHRDAVIDGVTIDVKSASTYSFDKFRKGLNPLNDDFGYLQQIGAYLEAGQDDDLVREKQAAGFVAVDKTLGHITLDLHPRSKVDYHALVAQKKQAIESSELPPRAYDDVPDGASGNRKLGTACSYCPVRRACWPGLRTFVYSNGLRHLTTVKRLPDVPEI